MTNQTDQNRHFLTTLANLGIATHRLDRIRDAARLHRQQLLGTSELYAVIEADDEQQPAGQTTPSHRAELRDHIAGVLWPLTDWDGDELNAERAADAVLAVLYREWPWLRAEAEDAAPPADRAAIYAEVAERLATDAEQGDKDGLTRIYRRSAAKQVREWADRLRRVADETATQTPAPDDRRLHACTQFGTWFDRSICAEPCGAMHTRCTECGVALDACPQQSAAGARQDGAHQ